MYSEMATIGQILTVVSLGCVSTILITGAESSVYVWTIIYTIGIIGAYFLGKAPSKIERKSPKRKQKEKN